MNMMFDNLADACTLLYVQGYRQNDDGVWIKEGKKLADIRRSPANDGVVCVVITKSDVPRLSALLPRVG
jgi:hypothetical protein